MNENLRDPADWREGNALEPDVTPSRPQAWVPDRSDLPEGFGTPTLILLVDDQALVGESVRRMLSAATMDSSSRRSRS